ncbi:hypothetical protein [Streptomyces sp. SBT349]|uniref:hypothetical protein n=1 Tax=Streptomyces sp. SBT349 TaxID=1580539 RepID=UPI00066C93A9|nr:hypothetical protein [Streptomyces sp. SBT349]
MRVTSFVVGAAVVAAAFGGVLAGASAAEASPQVSTGPVPTVDTTLPTCADAAPPAPPACRCLGRHATPRGCAPGVRGS